jgi:hypothetical protein
MTPNEILLTLKRTIDTLQRVNDSQVLQEIIEMPQASPELELIAINALDAVIKLQLRIQQAIDAELYAELNGIFEDVA